jgi:hypothetical protein
MGASTTGFWAPGDAADALVGEEAEHLALFFAVDQVVLVLHGVELRPAVRLGHVLHLGVLRAAEAVDVGGVPEGDAEFERLSEERGRGWVVERPFLT